MNFLKNFFNDDSTIIGLCGFGLEKSNAYARPFTNQKINPFDFEKVFVTNVKENVLLF